MDNKKIASELVKLAKSIVAGGLDGKFYITVDDSIDPYKLEDMAEDMVDDAGFDNFDVYSDDKRGLQKLINALKKKGVSSSRIMKN